MKNQGKQEEMVSLIAENAAISSYTDEFDERYRRIAEEISTLKEEQLEARRKKNWQKAITGECRIWIIS